jgi:non-reducing end alpha-L-arabinofuranosidase
MVSRARFVGTRGVLAVCALLALLLAGLVATPVAKAETASSAGPVYSGMASQRVALPSGGANGGVSRAAAAAAGVTLSWPGGDLVASVADGGLAQSTVSQYLTTDLPEAVGAQPGDSLSDLLQRTYAKLADEGNAPSSEAPPTFSGGTLSVSGSTITIDIPAASVQAIETASASEPPNGVITGPGGLCWHAASSAAGTPVDLQSCDGTQDQHFWLMTDGTIQIFNQCVTANGTGNGAAIVLESCNGANSQQWTQGGNGGGTLKNPASGRCLDDPSGSTTPGTALQLYDCNGSSAENWTWPGTSLVAGWVARIIGAVIGGLAGMVAYAGCLAFFTVGTGGAFAVGALTFCSFWWTFTWTLMYGVVVDGLTGVPLNQWATWENLMTGALVAGAVAAVGAYWGIPLFTNFPIWMRAQTIAFGNLIAQFASWVAAGASAAFTSFVNTVSGWLTAIANAAGNLPAIFADNGLATPGNSGTVTSGIAGKCLDDYGGNGNNADQVVLYTCNGAAAQNWTVFSNGNLSLNGRCLDIVGNSTASGTNVDLYDCNGTGGQVWEQVGNALVNPQSGLCLDDPNSSTTDGTALRIWTCNGSPAQQWILPGGSSGGGGGGTPPGGSSVCDIYAYYDTPCVAAYSTTRALYSSYDGPLYQVAIASGSGFGATENIGVSSPGGDVNAAAQDSFCGQYTCVITEIYDQSGHGNNLTIGPAGSGGGADQGAVANQLPITIAGHEAYGVDIMPGVGYRDNSTDGIAVNGEPEGMYMVASGTHANNGCCFDFGNAETNSGDNGNGHMDAVNLSTACWAAPCSGNGPWVEADLENGLFQGGNGSNTANAGNTSGFVTAMLKNNGQTTYELQGGNAQSGGVSKWYSGALPNLGGYVPMHQEGGITLGVGGDNSNRGIGSFFEGVMTYGYPSDQADAAVQANIVAAGYGGNPNGQGTGGSAVGQTINMVDNGGQCLDVAGDDTGLAGAQVQIWTCQSAAVDQHWTQLSNDSLRTLGRCLDLGGDGTAPGTKLDLWNCNGLGGQQFVPQPNGTLYNPQSGLCLDDPSGSTTNGTQVQIWNCNGNVAQNWTFNDASPTSSCTSPCLSNSAMPLEDPGGGHASPATGTGTITLAGGQCVNVGGDDGGHDGTIVDVWGCDSNAIDQQWTLQSNGSLKNGMGQCLDIDGNGTAAGTKVELWDCNGVGGQVWRPQSNGSLVNPQSGLCLDDPSGITANATQLQIWTCNGQSPQIFHVNGSANGGVAPVQGSPITLTGTGGSQCVDVEGNDTGGDGTPVDLYTCQSYAADQHWTQNSNDSLTTLGRCLDLGGDGTAPGTKLDLWDCNGVGGQQFVPQPNGTFYNPQSGLCLDDPSGSTANGTLLQIWNCDNNVAQNFTFNAATQTSSCSIAPCLSNSAMPLSDPGGGYAAPGGTTGTITLAGGQCVNVGGDDGGHDGTIVDVWGCDHNAIDQQWTWVTDGSSTTAGLANGMGQCLDIDGNGTAAGTKVELWDCDGVGGQQWVAQSNGSLLNPQSGLCLDDPSGNTADATQLQIWTCNGESPQVFHFNG